MNPQLQGVLRQPFNQQVAFFRQKLGNLIPTERWDEVWKGQHDRGFMVAGAMKADLLSDFASAVDRSITEGKSLDAFRKDFDAIVKRHGWDYTGERNWRTRTIYTTNMRTSYAAGRLAQLREGGFSHYMYRHGGSLEPRPEHLAWDGMVLPANHPFWRTHSPPNGFGCTCGVVGLRNPEDARSLGGDPDRQLPDGWDAIDAATGEPEGIGKGWGYAPGDTVSEAVQQMAAKTVQWEYTLAKAFMQNVPETVRDALSQSYRRLPSVADDLRRYAQRVLTDGAATVPQYRTLGLLTTAQAGQINTLTGLNVSGFDVAVDAHAVRHIQSRHGNDVTEAARGQRAITPADYARLPQVINEPDLIEDAGLSNKSKRQLVRLIKQLGDERWVVVAEVRGGRLMLALETLYIVKSR